jgi:hypothetical protein
MKESIYKLYLTPKDCFLRHNKKENGKMSYAEFNDFMIELSEKGREEIPSFAIIKDLFNFIDIKKDGVIDMKEWLQTFNNTSVLSSFLSS